MELYWLLRLPHLKILFILVSLISLIIGVVAFCAGASEDEWVFVKASVYVFAISFVFAVLACLCPDKTDLAIMLGWDAIRSESVQEVIELLKDKIK